MRAYYGEGREGMSLEGGVGLGGTYINIGGGGGGLAVAQLCCLKFYKRRFPHPLFKFVGY